MNKKILYVVEPFNWSIKWDGYYITSNIKKIYRYPAKIIYPSKRSFLRIKDHILHFGSRNVFLPDFYKYVNTENFLIMTWFHGTEKDIKYINLLPTASKKLNIIHTSCNISKNLLIKWGAQEDKIIVIPLGVDTKIFRSYSFDEKQKIRKALKIPDNFFVIGSFQKDGVGWGEGNDPKYEKGPEIFCSAVKILKDKKYPVFVLLTGPARGFVKLKLKEYNIPYLHYYLKNYLDIVRFYNALDLYIISSRAEGGPKALLECFATGVPLVSTKVGMVNDIGINEHNILTADIDDFKSLAVCAERLINEPLLKEKIIENALNDIKSFDWKIITQKYYEEIYRRFI